MTSKNKSKSTSDYSLKPFFELSSDLLCIAGFDGYFKRVNPAVCKVLGYTEEELLSKPINYFQYPDDKEITQKYREPILYGKPLTNFENRYITKRGDIVWFSWTSIPVRDDELIYAIAKNITHKKRQEEERNQLLSELSKNNQRLKQLTYTTSHDLRSPVSNLLSVFNLINTATIKDEETIELIGLLKTASVNLKKTLDNYVDDLNDEQTLHVQTTELDIRETLNSVKHSIDSFIRDSNTTFQLNFQEFHTLNFNKSYLESIFLNLITNSIKYSHPDRSPLIQITSRIKNGTKQLIFSDNGLGFDSDKSKEKIFGLYQQFHNHTDSKGIGLYLVYNHITDLGGHIQVESEINRGTTFTLSFKN